jgi:formylglycine-generating enzyme required for sulfatase activity
MNLTGSDPASEPDSLAPEFFQDGGDLDPNAPSYVSRPADGELLEHVLHGDFCYVLTPRQMGKSSLMHRTIRSLKERGVHSVIVDLTLVGKGGEEKDWYASIMRRIHQQLRIPISLPRWLDDHPRGTSVDRMSEFLEEVVLTHIQGQVVIFIDEIDTTLNLNWRDDFFAAIRGLYNRRASNPELHRLTFVLLGVASPVELIHDTARTPFNIGQAINLYEFSLEDAQVLVEGLDASLNIQGKGASRSGQEILTRIFHWTSGHPYLTQTICKAIAEQPIKQWSNGEIDELVRTHFLTEEARGEKNLKNVQARLLASGEKNELLRLYRKVLSGRRVADDGQSSLQNELKLSGLVKVDDGWLRVRNEIYRQAFDRAWLRRNLPANWVPLVVSISLVLALLAIGIMVYNFLVENQVTRASTDFITYSDPGERLENLVKIFHSKRLLVPSAYDDTGRRLFYGLQTWGEQRAIFEGEFYEDTVDDLTLVIRKVSEGAADVDERGESSLLLWVMVQSLQKLDAGDKTQEARVLEQELSYWIEARNSLRSLSQPESLTQQEEQQALEAALDQYNQAILLNEANPATRFERARLFARLEQAEDALSDLEWVLTHIGRARVTPRPTGTPRTEVNAEQQAAIALIEGAAQATAAEETIEAVWATATAEMKARGATATPGEMAAPNQEASKSPTPTSTATGTPTPAPTPVPPSELYSTESTLREFPIFSKFDDIEKRRSAVKNLIQNLPALLDLVRQNPGGKFTTLYEAFPTPSLAERTATLQEAEQVMAVLQTQQAQVWDGYDLAFLSHQEGSDTNQAVMMRSSDPTTWKELPEIDPGMSAEGISYCPEHLVVYWQDLEAPINARPYFYDPTRGEFLYFEPAGSYVPITYTSCSWDGRYLAFYGITGTNSGLFVYDAVTQEEILVQESQTDLTGLAWGPDNQLIWNQTTGKTSEIWQAVAADSFGTPETLISDAGYGAFSPEGKQLAYRCQNQLSLCVFSIDGKGDEILAEDIFNPNFVSATAWSADGEWIYYASDADGDLDIYRINPAGRPQENLTNDWQGDEFSPAVLPPVSAKAGGGRMEPWPLEAMRTEEATFTPQITATTTLETTPFPTPVLFAETAYYCRGGPSINNHIYGVFEEGATTPLLGRAGNGWWLVSFSDPAQSVQCCWVAGGQASGSVDSVPLITGEVDLTNCPAPPQGSTLPNSSQSNLEAATPPVCTAVGQTWTSPIDGMTLVCVPAGEFTMGSEEGDDVEKPVHTVFLDAFWIDETEVTNAMFAKFVAETNHQNAGSSETEPSDHPVTEVYWNDAASYCQWAQRQLPSEAQWEKAARGTDGRTYPWGNEDPDCKLANSAFSGVDTGYCVGSKTPAGSYLDGASPFEALDMAGNVWEWVNDWYQAGYYSNSPERDPTGPAEGTDKVTRGGSWTDLWDNLRTSYRGLYDPASRSDNIGFRCGVLPGR